MANRTVFVVRAFALFVGKFVREKVVSRVLRFKLRAMQDF